MKIFTCGWQKALILCLIVGILVAEGGMPAYGIPSATPGQSVRSPTTGQAIRISQVYGGGGNTGAPYKCDFVELFNASGSAVNISGWSVQYAANGSSSWSKHDINSLTASAYGYILLQERCGTNGVDLPTPDATGTLNMSATTAKVALVSNQTALSGICPTDSAIQDLVGYGSTVDCYEGTTAAPTLSNTTAALRKGSGCQDNDQNGTDFSSGTPDPRNSSSSNYNCSLAVPLASFSAISVPGSIHVVWETVSELNVQGYHLYRADVAGGTWTRLNPELIPSQAPGSPQGFSYAWADATVARGLSYWYRVVAVGPDGGEEPLQVVRADYPYAWLWLPMVARP